MINTCIIGGKVTRPPRQLQGQSTKGLSFNVNVEDASGKKVLFMDVVAWGDATHDIKLDAGDYVVCSGQIRARSYVNKENATIWVKELSCPQNGITVITSNGGGSPSDEEEASGESQIPF